MRRFPSSARAACLGLLGLAPTLLPAPAHAFCGFYVAGADTRLYNDATMVVLLRDGTKTVLSMQNNYQGPPEAFAMVVPVPQVLQKENVRTLPKDVFAHVDRLGAPRLVEYWEQDPCFVPPPEEEWQLRADLPGAIPMEEGGVESNLGVKVEARFEVGEYDVVILSARDSGGLDQWLRQEHYHIPEGAEPVLRPYVEAGTKFFVAKVIPEKVAFQDGHAVLSPLRMHYDDDKLQLPVRLGLLNSKGQQDLVVNVLAHQKRYEVANYANAFLPTNLRVRDEVRKDFGGFYESLFTEVARPGTVVTEYSWDAGSCDPCPTPPLGDDDLMTLGADVVGGPTDDFTLTRLHYRYGAEGLGEDLVFREAPGVVGGRGVPDPSGELQEREPQPSGTNQFQGRYVILHRWEGPLACKDPVRGRWGGPPAGEAQQTASAPSALTRGGATTGGTALADVLVDGIPGVTPTPAPPPPSTTAAEEAAVEKAERRCDTSASSAGLGAVLLAASGLRGRRRSASRP